MALLCSKSFEHLSLLSLLLKDVDTDSDFIWVISHWPLRSLIVYFRYSTMTEMTTRSFPRYRKQLWWYPFDLFWYLEDVGPPLTSYSPLYFSMLLTLNWDSEISNPMGSVFYFSSIQYVYGCYVLQLLLRALPS